MTATQMNALMARRKSVLDFVGGQLNKFATNLGTDDKAKVQSHLQAIQSLENQLTTMSSSGTARPARRRRSRRPASTSTRSRTTRPT